jgi:hypothetical protein
VFRIRTDILAVTVIVLASVVTTWPLLARLDGVPPDDDDLDLDLLLYYGYAAAARTTALHFGQFPLRSPWHGGGYPMYAYPDDMTLTPTMPLILAVGPFAAIKIDFVLTMIAAGLGMYLFTRRALSYSPAAALFSATAFALGGFLLARWLRGWRQPTHAVWLPVILYALWRGRDRRAWLALAAALVAWLILDQKYAAIVMGWFLLMVGLLFRGRKNAARVSPCAARHSSPSAASHASPSDTPVRADPAFSLDWGYFVRLALVWAVGAGLSAVKLVPMAPLLMAHLASETRLPGGGDQPAALAVWGTIFAALGLTPFLARLVRARRTRPIGLLAAAGTLAVVIGVVVLLAPPSRDLSKEGAGISTRAAWVRHVADCLFSFGAWRQNADGDWTPTAGPVDAPRREAYRFRSPVGPIVFVLALVAVVRRPRQTWEWALLAGLLLVCDLGPAIGRELDESFRRLPLLSWVRRPREQLNFYLFFLLTLLAGRALDFRRRGRRRVSLAAVAWTLVAANVVFLAYNGFVRYRYSVSASAPPARGWSDEFQLLDRPYVGDVVKKIGFWRNRPAFLIRDNIGLQRWETDFVESPPRYERLAPTLLVQPDGSFVKCDPAPPMASFDFPGNTANVTLFTPNRIVVRVNVVQPDVLIVNQIGDDDWRPSRGALVPGSSLLLVHLDQTGEYAVTLRYVPALLHIGLVVGLVTAALGAALLFLTRRRRLRP